MSAPSEPPDVATPVDQPAAPEPDGSAHEDAEVIAVTDERADPEIESAVSHRFGRIAVDGRVFVRTADGEREVGSWQAGDPAAGLAHFERRFETLTAQVDLLAARVEAGTVEPAAALSSVARLRNEISQANAVGDIDALLARTDALAESARRRQDERRAARAAERRAALDKRRALAEEADKLVDSEDWRGTGDRFRAIVEEWKAASLADRAASDELWHVISRAQSTFRKRRHQHAVAVESARAETVRVKEALVAEAESIATSSDWRETSRLMADLMERWKAAGRARRDVDEELWQRFRTARDAFFERRAAADTTRQRELEGRIDTLRRLVAEAEAIPADAPLKEAEARLRRIRERWGAVGPVPRAMADPWADRLATVSDRIRHAEDERWRRQAAQSSPLIVKLREAVAQREARLEKARAAGRTDEVAAAEAELEVQRGWLRQAEESARR